jgi:putative ABC transport system ATP-binding protein
MMSLIESLNFEEDILEKNFSDLSGGERQRIAIIQVLMLDKKVYLLDEITSALDPVNIRNVIKTLSNDPRRTLVTVSHDQHWDDVPIKKIVLSKGRMTVMEKQIGR